MSETSCLKVNKQEFRDWVERERAKIKVVDDSYFRIKDDDPVLLRKQEEAMKSFNETRLPEWLRKRMRGEE
jgi:hypothetical protein